MPRYSKSDKLDLVVDWRKGQTYNHTDGDEPYAVYGYGIYPRSSVLAGQTRKVFMDSFSTIEAARKAFPEAQVSANLEEAWRDEKAVAAHEVEQDGIHTLRPGQ